MKITVLDGYCLNPGDLSWDALRAFGEVEIFDRTPPDQTVARAAGAAILLTNKTALPAAVLDQLPDLRYIAVLATGYNVIDIEAARRKGIVVSNVPTYATASVNSSSPSCSNSAIMCDSTPTRCGRVSGRAIQIGVSPRLR